MALPTNLLLRESKNKTKKPVGAKSLLLPRSLSDLLSFPQDLHALAARIFISHLRSNSHMIHWWISQGQIAYMTMSVFS